MLALLPWYSPAEVNSRWTRWEAIRRAAIEARIRAREAVQSSREATRAMRGSEPRPWQT